MDAENAVLEYRLIERNIYGSAQVGICKDTVDLNITNAAGALTQATYYHARQLNHRQYSLSNHLGNVLTTIGDGKAAVDSNSDGVIDYFVAYIISVSDYSPFGVELANRSWSIEEYRSGFQKQEKDKELWEGAMYYKYRVEDPRLGRFFSVDPLYAKYPYNSNYAFSENKLINGVEIEGLENKATYNVLQDGTKSFSHAVNDGKEGYREEYITWDGKANIVKREEKSVSLVEFSNFSGASKKTYSKNAEEKGKERAYVKDENTGFGFNKPRFTANISAYSGGAVDYAKIGGVYNAGGAVVFGVKDNTFYVAGNNTETSNREVFKSYELSSYIVGVSNEKTMLGGRNGAIISEKNTVSLFSVFYVETTSFPDGTTKSNIGILLSYKIGVGLILDGAVQIPFYTE
jgi:RHS repeat-associated protein